MSLFFGTLQSKKPSPKKSWPVIYILAISLVNSLSYSDMVLAQPVVPHHLKDKDKKICLRKQYLATLNIMAGDSNTLINVVPKSSNPKIATTGYDSASKTVEGHGVGVGTARITVRGDVEAVNGKVPFEVWFEVEVKAC